jgi:hypothetical protein
MKYTIIENLFGQDIIQREDENGTIVFIPMDEGNADYQRYLNPEAEHFTPMIPGDE